MKHIFILGVIATDLSRHIEDTIPVCCRCCIPFGNWMLKTPFHGAQTTLYCTLDDSIENHSGKYYKDCAESSDLNDYANDINAAKTLWEISEKLVGLKS